MAKKFICQACGATIIAYYNLPGESMWCHECGANVTVPQNAENIEMSMPTHEYNYKSQKEYPAMETLSILNKVFAWIYLIVIIIASILMFSAGSIINGILIIVIGLLVFISMLAAAEILIIYIDIKNAVSDIKELLDKKLKG